MQKELCGNLITTIEEKIKVPKHIVFFAGEYCDVPWIQHGWNETQEMIAKHRRIIWTTQMALMDTSLFALGYQIIVWDKTGQYEIKLGNENDRTLREIRLEHNLFHMWRGGEFDHDPVVIENKRKELYAERGKNVG